MSEVITGSIEAVTSKRVASKYSKDADGMSAVYSVKINGTWYGAGFKPVSFTEGSQITGIVTRNGDHLNIKDMTLASGSLSSDTYTVTGTPAQDIDLVRAPTVVTVSGKDSQIMRQNAVTNANALFSNLIASGVEVTVDEDTVIKVAQRFYEFYTTGE